MAAPVEGGREVAEAVVQGGPAGQQVRLQGEGRCGAPAQQRPLELHQKEKLLLKEAGNLTGAPDQPRRWQP